MILNQFDLIFLCFMIMVISLEKGKSNQTTVNSPYCRHSGDHDLMFSIERARNNERLFQSNVYRKS